VHGQFALHGVDPLILVETPRGLNRDPANEYSEGGLHTISIVHLVKPLSYDIKLDDQATDWGWSKELPEKLGIAPLPILPGIPRPAIHDIYEQTF
jgi:hypothetical protein